MILLSEMLANEKPKHRIEQVMLISEYECGCQTTITFAGRPSSELISNSSNLWHCSNKCIKNHSVSFEEIESCKSVSLLNIATEIFGFNSIAVSVSASASTKIENFKKVA